MNDFNKIYFISDPFRPDYKGCLPYINYIKDTVNFAIQFVTGMSLDCSLINYNDNMVFNNGFDLKEFFKPLDVRGNIIDGQFSLDFWSKIYHSNPSDKQINYFSKFLNLNSVVVSYEAPPIILKLLQELNIPYIDLRISPIKFFRDLILGAKTNSPEFLKKIMKYKMPEEIIFYEANLIEATSNFKRLNKSPEEPFSLIIAQAKGDSSLIFDEKQYELYDFKNLMEDEFSKASHKIYFKKNPCQNNVSTMDWMRDLGVEDLPLNHNMYDLLSNKNLCKLYSISSGTLQEAYYFNKNIHYFKTPIYDYVKNESDIANL